jgi:hypothetical protein
MVTSATERHNAALAEYGEAHVSENATRLENASATLDSARAAAQEASTRPRFPVNICCTSSGNDALCHSLAALTDPHQPGGPCSVIIHDDVQNMYNTTKRAAMFEMLRRRWPVLIPGTAFFYGSPARVRLIRENGELRAPTAPDVAPTEQQDDDVALGELFDVDPDYDHCTPVDLSEVCRSCEGGQQGCPMATVLCCATYHEVLHTVQRDNKSCAAPTTRTSTTPPPARRSSAGIRRRRRATALGFARRPPNAGSSPTRPRTKP